jgi:ASC-1-like (ASCH) protein
MKIRDEFIDSIIHGKKKHEYRLGIPERKALEPGDQLVLTSIQDQNRHVRVSVVKKEEFPNWETALYKYWKDDFSGNYKSIDEVKKDLIW